MKTPKKMMLTAVLTAVLIITFGTGLFAQPAVYRNEVWGFEFQYPSSLPLNILVDKQEDDLFFMRIGVSVFELGISMADMASFIRRSAVEEMGALWEEKIEIEGHVGTAFYRKDDAGLPLHILSLVVQGRRAYVFLGHGPSFFQIFDTFQFVLSSVLAPRAGETVQRGESCLVKFHFSHHLVQLPEETVIRISLGKKHQGSPQYCLS